jgi:2-keto-4-pentenoate hydratase/2-oxohepta-3-ene-1,7-dioic acid hydratase in catechol pathway
MRLANIDGRLTTFLDGTALDVERASTGTFGPDPQAVFDRWDELVAWGIAVGASGGGDFDPAKLDAPVPRPRQVFAIGLNYRAHAAEGAFSAPEEPTVFPKWPACIVGQRHDVVIPVDTTDYEVELVAVIARPTWKVAAASAWSHVAGFTIGQDLSDRTLQRKGPAPQWGLAKSYAGFGPTGPWLVTLDELDDPADLAISDRLGDTTLQDARTSSMIFDVPFVIEYISNILPMYPGDLIFTGTPAGVGYTRDPPIFLKPGDELVSEIEGIGRLVTRCVAPDGS